MNSNLRNIEKNLRAFAKRSKSIKFSAEMLLAFLISGISGFATKKSVSPDSSTEGAKKQLVSSIGDMKKLFKEARQENNTLLRISNLELIQLMEQGDHVVKSPWNSWQFEANFYYDNWHGSFKGKGDKIYENQVYLRQSQNFSDSLLRYVKDNKNLNSYNLTELNIVPEYPVTVSISAGIRPKSVNKAETTFVPQAPTSSLPPFEPKMVGTPSKPNSPNPTEPSFFTSPTITANGQSFSQRATIGHRDKDEFLNQISPSYPNQSVTQNYDSYSNTGTINIADSANTNSINIGMFTNDAGTAISNDGTLNVGKNSYGIYGKNVTTGINSKINVGDNGVGLFSNGNSVTVNGELNINPNEAVGVFTSGNGPMNITNNANIFTIGDNSYGFVLRSGATPERIQANGGTTGLGATTFVSNTPSVTLGNDAVYVYSADTLGTVTNNTAITTTGSNNYGLYSAGNVVNNTSGNMNLTSGVGNVGIYSIENGNAKNYATIDVGSSESNNGIIGVAALNNSVIKNYGRIIIAGNGNIGVYTAGNGTYSQETGSNPAQGGAVTTGSITATNGATDRKNEAQVATDKTVGGINIIAPAGASVATIERNGVQVPIDSIDTVSPVPQPQYVTVNNTSLIDLNNLNNGATNVNLAKASSLGMYVDTSGVNYTNPIKGIQNLNLSNVNLILGLEASKYTLSRDIEVGDSILKPFNDVLAPLAQNGLTMSYISGALNWIATATYKTDGTLSKVYMSKIPYTAYAKTGDTDNYNFLDGLEQKYGVDGINTREKALFDKLNAIGKGESRIFVQAVDEMKGYQYSNTQQRIVSTGRILEKEFDYLKDE